MLRVAGVAVAQDPTQKAAAVNIGLVHAAQSQFAQALAACEPLQPRFHGYGMLDYCLGLGYMGQGNRFTDAVALLRAAGRAADGPQHSVRHREPHVKPTHRGTACAIQR